MTCAISVGASRQLTATLTALSFDSANVASKYSGPFLSRNATRSPSPMPTAASALASWFDRASSSPNVMSSALVVDGGRIRVRSRPCVRTIPAID